MKLNSIKKIVNFYYDNNTEVFLQKLSERFPSIMARSFWHRDRITDSEMKAAITGFLLEKNRLKTFKHINFPYNKHAGNWTNSQEIESRLMELEKNRDATLKNSSFQEFFSSASDFLGGSQETEQTETISEESANPAVIIGIVITAISAILAAVQLIQTSEKS